MGESGAAGVPAEIGSAAVAGECASAGITGPWVATTAERRSGATGRRGSGGTDSERRRSSGLGGSTGARPDPVECPEASSCRPAASPLFDGRRNTATGTSVLIGKRTGWADCEPATG
jgi:hypothetical protein